MHQLLSCIFYERERKLEFSTGDEMETHVPKHVGFLLVCCMHTHTLEMCELAVDSEVHFYDTFCFSFIFYAVGWLVASQPISHFYYLSPIVMTPSGEIA